MNSRNITKLKILNHINDRENRRIENGQSRNTGNIQQKIKNEDKQKKKKNAQCRKLKDEQHGSYKTFVYPCDPNG